MTDGTSLGACDSSVNPVHINSNTYNGPVNC